MATPQYRTEETNETLAEDRLLRKWGFQIHSRKPGEPAEWKLTDTGDVFTHEEALELAEDFQQDDAKHEDKAEKRKKEGKKSFGQ